MSLRNFHSNFQLQLSSNASKVYVIELSYIIVFNSVTLNSHELNLAWIISEINLSFLCHFLLSANLLVDQNLQENWPL